MGLAEQKCVPCELGAKPLSPEEAKVLMREIPAWTLTEKTLERDFTLVDFLDAIAFVNHLASVAEEQGHHPDITISYNKVHLTLSTHKIGGLSNNDFILAAKIDKLMPGMQKAA